MYELHFCAVTDSQNSKIPSISSTSLVGFISVLRNSFISCQRFSIGFKSGDSVEEKCTHLIYTGTREKYIYMNFHSRVGSCIKPMSKPCYPLKTTEFAKQSKMWWLKIDLGIIMDEKFILV